MTPDDLLKEHRAEANKRLASMRALFTEIQDFITIQLGTHGDLDAAIGKEVMKKIGDLQSLQVSLLKAEERFFEKLETDVGRSKSDYDTIRREIGRALNRIRTTDSAEGVSGGACRPSD